MLNPIDSQIQVLPHDVIDQIAAGEVVERPSHLVKELVENSIDAGATSVSVNFSEGGRYVQVADNGFGIAAEQLGLALDRHATSKIRLSSDLWRLHSFGFRGEALASIAAVSRLTLVSRQREQKSAARIVSEFGRRSSVEEIGGSFGTTITVEELFSNVPARLKFMKSAAAEGSRIKQTLKAIALSHPHVEIKVSQDHQMLSFWPACENRMQRVKQVLQLEEVFEGSAQREGVKAYALFSGPSHVQKSAKDLWFFAQSRWIQDRGLQAAVTEAYRHLLMHGEYPMVVVWVETEADQIDVNIHPTKSQVKFLDPSLAFRAVQAAIRDTLEKAPWLPTAPAEKFVLSSPEIEIENLRFQSPELAKTQYAQKNYFSHSVSNPPSKVLDTLQTYRSPAVTSSHVSPQVTQNQNENLQSVTSFESTMDIHRSADLSSEVSVVKPGITKSGFWSSLQVLAQAHLTYIVTQNEKGMIFVDQHAAHERVMFEKLMSAWKGGKLEVQDFLFPLAIDLSAEQVEALLLYQVDLNKLGIELESLGPETVGVKSSPVILKENALVMALRQLSQDIVEKGGSFVLERKIGDMFATMACHSAVRAGQALSAAEMNSLLQSMDEFPLSSFCPHGRPVSVDYNFYQLEKDFGRIV